jgi:valyl-tRNA synthetase
VGERHNLEIINTINPDATLNELAGKYNTLDRFVARKAILADLESADLIEKIEDYTHNVGFSQRGGEVIEPYLSDQWFVNMKSFAELALEPVLNGEIKFYPTHWTKTYEHWMRNIRDWCISRQLWWGHRIPVYYTEDGKFTAARSEEEAREKLNLPPNTSLKQDEDTLDTWFSSWLWPMTTMGWLTDDESDLEKFLPTDLLVTAPEIIFFWVARMIMASKKFVEKIPFKNVYFTSIIRDGQGRKLSKSLGNSPDPLNIIAKYGADAVRFSMIYLSPLGQDVRMEVDVKNQDIASIELGRNFANKIWNAGRFLLMKQEEAGLSETSLDETQLSYADKWILARYNLTLQRINEALDNYKVTEYAKILYDFIWRDFCDWYVEILKVQFFASSDNDYKKKLMRFATNLYENILKIIHPVMPFISEELYHLTENRDENESILQTEFPKIDSKYINAEIEQQFELVQSVVEEVRKLRASMNIVSQKLPAIISIQDETTLNTFRNLDQVIKNLCKFTELEITKDEVKSKMSVSTVFRGIEVHLMIAGAVDLDKEKQRIEKEIARLEGNIRVCENKLKNEKFVNNAAPEIVQNEREKLKSMQESLAKNKENLMNLGK